MKNIMVIDGAENCVYDVFAATDEEFCVLFQEGADIAFIDEVYQAMPEKTVDETLDRIWSRRLQKRHIHGLHGILFYELDRKKKYYPTRRDEEAINPDGTLIR